MKKHLLVLLLGLSIIYAAVFGWAYFIDGANEKWYAFPISVIFLNVFLVGCPIALAGYEAVKDALKSSGAEPVDVLVLMNKIEDEKAAKEIQG